MCIRDSKSIGEIINLGSNYEISIGDTAHLIAETMGLKIEIICDEQRLRPEKSEVERLWASNEKGKKILGWSPLYAGIEGFKCGITETVNWFTNPDNLSAYKSDSYTI